jgi:outer membrane protein OmpA-like peptidoglycan-associated protein
MAVPGLAATRHLGEVRLDANLGYALRGEGQWAQLVVHDGLVYGLGASGDLPRPRALAGLRGIAELTGGWPRGAGGGTERYRAPLSVRGGLRAALGRALGGVLSVELGAGAGLGEAGYGREAWRVFAGLRLAPPPRAPGAEPDPDGDGLTGPGDRCPREAGPAELDGCPDRDGDAIPDPQDRCPDRPGPAKQEGCPPPEQEPDVVVETDRISLKDAINFDTGRATIKQGSFPILDKVAALLVARPELGRVRIEGHTDNVGGAAYNRDLSRRRAQAVVDHLAARGVARARLVAEGFGFDRPVADNATALGRAKNRRVEFTILSEGAP